VSESACPFCGSALSDTFRATPARQAPRVRLTRAALFALGTGVALTPGCSPSSSGSPGTGTEQGDDGGITAQPLYGAVAYDAGEPADAGATGSDGATGASDAAGTTDAGSTTDGEPPDDGGHTAQPLYGASVYDGGYAALYGGYVGH
jgi:hypothetical protein